MSKEKEPETTSAEDPETPIDPKSDATDQTNDTDPPSADEPETLEAEAEDPTAEPETVDDTPELVDDTAINDNDQADAEFLSDSDHGTNDVSVSEQEVSDPEAAAMNQDPPSTLEHEEALDDAAAEAEITTESVHERAEVSKPAKPETKSGGSGFASSALKIVVLIIFVIGITLWAGPKMAPHVPGWASKYLTTAPNELTGQVKALQERVSELEQEIASFDSVTEKLAALESADSASIATTVVDLQTDTNAALDAAGEAQKAAAAAQTAVSELATEIEVELGAVETSFETADALISDVGAKTSSVENALGAKISSLESEVGALAGAFENAQDQQDGSVPAAQELQAAMQALQTRVDGLAAALAVLPDLVRAEDTAVFATKEDLAGIEAEVAAVAAAAEEAMQIGGNALSSLETSVRMAAVRGSISTLMSRITGGLPYADALTEIEGLSGVTAPEPLSAPAAQGLATQGQLLAGFSEAARATMAVSQGGSRAGSTGSLITAWLEAQVSARPTIPTDGAGTGAVLSRVEAALQSGDLSAALTETEALSGAAVETMAPWTAQLAAKVSAEAALPDFIAAVGGQG